jgi:hypothetical protein
MLRVLRGIIFIPTSYEKSTSALKSLNLALNAGNHRDIRIKRGSLVAKAHLKCAYKFSSKKLCFTI